MLKQSARIPIENNETLSEIMGAVKVSSDDKALLKQMQCLNVKCDEKLVRY